MPKEGRYSMKESYLVSKEIYSKRISLTQSGLVLLKISFLVVALFSLTNILLQLLVAMALYWLIVPLWSLLITPISFAALKRTLSGMGKIGSHIRHWLLLRYPSMAAVIWKISAL